MSMNIHKMQKDKINIVQILISAGLSYNAARIYEYLLEVGSSKIISISKSLNISRTSVYDYVAELTKIGFINIKDVDGKVYYSADDLNLVIEKLKDINSKHENYIKFLLSSKNFI